jgi:hypothetical protein
MVFPVSGKRKVLEMRWFRNAWDCLVNIVAVDPEHDWAHAALRAAGDAGRHQRPRPDYLDERFARFRAA